MVRWSQALFASRAIALVGMPAPRRGPSAGTFRASRARVLDLCGRDRMAWQSGASVQDRRPSLNMTLSLEAALKRGRLGTLGLGSHRRRPAEGSAKRRAPHE